MLDALYRYSQQHAEVPMQDCNIAWVLQLVCDCVCNKCIHLLQSRNLFIEGRLSPCLLDESLADLLQVLGLGLDQILHALLRLLVLRMKKEQR